MARISSIVIDFLLFGSFSYRLHQTRMYIQHTHEWNGHRKNFVGKYSKLFWYGEVFYSVVYWFYALCHHFILSNNLLAAVDSLLCACPIHLGAFNAENDVIAFYWVMLHSDQTCFVHFEYLSCKLAAGMMPVIEPFSTIFMLLSIVLPQHPDNESILQLEYIRMSQSHLKTPQVMCTSNSVAFASVATFCTVMYAYFEFSGGLHLILAFVRNCHGTKFLSVCSIMQIYWSLKDLLTCTSMLIFSSIPNQ